MSELYRRAKELFLQAVDMPEQARDAFIEQACAGEPALMERVRALIASDSAEESWLDEKAAGLLGFEASGSAATSQDAPVRIGPYRLLGKIGQGGMGEVYEAEQIEPIRRRVALKIIKQGMDTRQVIARFEAERQALALMDHPFIASVYEAGATPQGRPFFAMELVRGKTITQHCDQERLTTRQRLLLFLDVCEGVQHAHENAIIHRDLKPSNVLVAVQGDRAVPKIIDFGVAKATTQKLTELTMATEAGVLIGTPEYMSPEQADLSEQNIDTRTDVYALGVILYELLVGALPFESSDMRRGGVMEILERIRREEPSRPSTRVSSLGEGSTESARRRRVDPAALQRLLKGDLDWITMKALEKDRQRRYASPHELAADIRRYLGDEPILARPPSAAYQLRKFARRHKALVIGAAAVVAALGAGLVVSTTQAIRATRAERLAQARLTEVERQSRITREINAFLNDDVLGAVDPEQTGRDDVGMTVVQAVDAAAARLEKKALAEPLIEASIRAALGTAYRGLGEFEKAEVQLIRAREIYDAVQPDAEVSLAAGRDLAALYVQMGRAEEGLALIQDVVERQRRVLGEQHPETLMSLAVMAQLHSARGFPEQAIPILQQVVETQEAVLGPEDPVTLASAHELVVANMNAGHWDRAEELALENLQRKRQVYQEQDPELMTTVGSLAMIYMVGGRPDEAEPLMANLVESRRESFGEKHPRTLLAMSNLANVYLDQGRPEEAVALLQVALAGREEALGPGHRQTLNSLATLAWAQWDLGRREEGLRLQRLGLERSIEAFGLAHPYTIPTLRAVGTMLLDMSRFDEALPVLQQAVGLARTTEGLRPDDLPRAVSEQGRCLAGLKRFDEAEASLLEGYELTVDIQGSRWRPKAAQALADFYDARGRAEEAGRWRVKAP